MGQGLGKDFCCAQRSQASNGCHSKASSAPASQEPPQGEPQAELSPATLSPSPPVSTDVSEGDVINVDCGEAAKSKDQSKGCEEPPTDTGDVGCPVEAGVPSNGAMPDSEELTSSPQVAAPKPSDAPDRTPPIDREVDSELLEAGSTARIRSESNGEQAAQPKGKGKGKSKMPPPPKASAPKPKAQPPKPAVSTGSSGAGMSALLSKVEAVGKKKDLEEAKEIEDIDLSQIDPSAAREKVTCPRCEKEVLKEHFESHMTAHSSEILPWLFLGGKRNLENDKELTVRTNITHVLNLAQEVNLKEDFRIIATEYNLERGLPFVYKKFSFGDTPDQHILPELDSAVQFIHDARSLSQQHHVLVNCVQGISRSASVVIAYLMKYEHMHLREAYDHVRERRTVADPRKEFVDQLAQFECQIFGLDKPSLTGAIAFEGRTLLNLDDPLPQSERDCEEGAEVQNTVPAAPKAGTDVVIEEDILNKLSGHAIESREWYADANPANSPTKTAVDVDGKATTTILDSQTVDVTVPDQS